MFAVESNTIGRQLRMQAWENIVSADITAPAMMPRILAFIGTPS
jgi:hypothetical protein